jgi:hypothetical protein
MARASSDDASEIRESFILAHTSTSEKPCPGQTGHHSQYPALSASYPFLNHLFSFKFSFIAKQISYQL